MTYITILTIENIIEGIVASIAIVSTYYILRNWFKLSKPISSMGGWFITWTFRKFSVNIYNHLHDTHKLNLKPIQIKI